ncbi:MAG: leucine-rich repeat protein [Oscillospiraceae bacterium]|nr:leucine-rich repeat protein [Oscillospiraceae bacterium]
MKKYDIFFTCLTAFSILVSSLLLFQSAVPVRADANVLYEAEYELYYLNTEEYPSLSIPDECATVCTLALPDSASGLTFTVAEGYNNVFTISETGTLSVGNSPRAGDFTLIASNDSLSLSYLVHLNNYATVYCRTLLKDYLEQHITASMTNEEKLHVIAEYAASFPYQSDNGYMEKILLDGIGGNCNASVKIVNTMASLLGFKARSNDVPTKIGSVGIGHSNSVVLDDQGIYYVIDCGLNEPAPRNYLFSSYSCPFEYEYLEDSTVKVSAYIGFENDIVIPDVINGKHVSAIGEYLDYSYQDISSVAIPASVTQIAGNAFQNTDSAAFSIDPANESFVWKDRILYSKDMKTLVAATGFHLPMQYNAVYIPRGVETIAPYAFSNCESLTEVIFPDTLQIIGKCAFEASNIANGIVMPASVTFIGSKAFHNSSAPYYLLKSDGCAFDEDDSEVNLTFWSNGQINILLGNEKSAMQQFAESYKDFKNSVGITSRYLFQSMNITEQTTIASGSGWSLVISPEREIILHLEGTNITKLDSNFKFTDAVTQLYLADTVTGVSSATVISKLKNLKSISGSENSQAKTIAGKKKLPFISSEKDWTGDCNHDGTCDIADVEMLRNWLLYGTPPTHYFHADLNQNGILDVMDLTMMKRMALS